MVKPNLSVVVTSIADPSITKTFTKANGLLNLNVEGVSDNAPYYGIIARSGTITLIDIPDENNQEGWLKTQSDNNILPDVSIDVYINNILFYSFVADSDIKYNKQDNKVTINLVDTIQSLQSRSLPYGILFENYNAYTVFVELCSQIGISSTMSENTKQRLISIRISKMFINKDTFWNVLDQFVYGAKCILYKEGDLYLIREVNE